MENTYNGTLYVGDNTYEINNDAFHMASEQIEGKTIMKQWKDLFYRTLNKNQKMNRMITTENRTTHIKRLTYIDNAKTLCIFLMVVGHYTSNSILINYIYSFHMPALFLISGYLYRRHDWWKTIIAFGVPVLVLSSFHLVVKFIIGEIRLDNISFSSILLQTIYYRYGLGVESLFNGIWFLYALIGMRFLFGDIKHLQIMRKNTISITIIAILAFSYMVFESYLISIDTIFHGYLIGRMVPSLPFFCFGMYLKDKNWSPQNLTIKYVALIFLLSTIEPLINGKTDINSNCYGFSYAIFAVFAILFTVMVLCISDWIPRSKYAETISKGTLVVLGAHTPIHKILIFLLPSSLSFIFPFIAIITCYFIILISEKYFPILLGKIK